MIRLTKSDAGYIVEASPPHVREAWLSTQPIEKSVLIRKLLDLGAHTQDIGDAMDLAEKYPGHGV